MFSTQTIRHALITLFRSMYNSNRDPFTRNTPEVSRQFFQIWEENGLIEALKYFRMRQKTMGVTWIPASIKVMFNLLGSTLISLGLRKKSNQTNVTGLAYATLYSFALFTLALSQGGEEVSGNDLPDTSDGSSSDIEYGINGRRPAPHSDYFMPEVVVVDADKLPDRSDPDFYKRFDEESRDAMRRAGLDPDDDANSGTRVVIR